MSTNTASLKVCTAPVGSAGKTSLPNGTRLAGLPEQLWSGKQRILPVRFMNGAPTLQRKVMQAALEWCKHANIYFYKTDRLDAPVRVQFSPGPSWSYIGTAALALQDEPTVPTVTFGWLTAGTPLDEVSRVVLHEFGHVLGFVHEHQSPASGIPWDTEAVYETFSQEPYCWTEQEILHNIIKRHAASQSNHSEFDPHSIMLYAIPPELTKGQFQTSWNHVLSPTDKRYIADLYPFADQVGATLQVGASPVHGQIDDPLDSHLYPLAISSPGRFIFQLQPSDNASLMLFHGKVQLQSNHVSAVGWKQHNRIIIDLGPGSYAVRVRCYSPLQPAHYALSLHQDL
jgi:serralysin